MGARGPLSATSAVAIKPLRRIPPPPLDLKEAGTREWERAVAEIGPKGRNVITASALGVLEDLARAADDAATFRAEWVREGLTVVGKGREFGHPMIAAEREVRRTMNQLRCELGLTPRSAVRVPSGPARGKKKSGFEDVE